MMPGNYTMYRTITGGTTYTELPTKYVFTVCESIIDTSERTIVTKLFGTLLHLEVVDYVVGILSSDSVTFWNT